MGSQSTLSFRRTLPSYFSPSLDFSSTNDLVLQWKLRSLDVGVHGGVPISTACGNGKGGQTQVKRSIDSSRGHGFIEVLHEEPVCWIWSELGCKVRSGC